MAASEDEITMLTWLFTASTPINAGVRNTLYRKLRSDGDFIFVLIGQQVSTSQKHTSELLGHGIVLYIRAAYDRNVCEPGVNLDLLTRGHIGFINHELHVEYRGSNGGNQRCPIKFLSPVSTTGELVLRVHLERTTDSAALYPRRRRTYWTCFDAHSHSISNSGPVRVGQPYDARELRYYARFQLLRASENILCSFIF